MKKLHLGWSAGIGLFAICVGLAGCAAAEEPVDKPDMQKKQVPVYDARTFYDTTSIFGASFSQDESRLLITTDASGIFNAYSQPYQGGEPQALTQSRENAVFGVSWFPHDDRFLYTSDQGGNELNHLYVQPAEGESRDLTPGEKVKADFLGWSGDKKHFWVQTNERDPRFFDVYRYGSEDLARVLVFKNDEQWGGLTVSPDGRWMALGKILNNANSDIYLWDSRPPAKRPRLITRHDGDVQHQAVVFTPDSSRLVYLTDGKGEYMQAWSYDVAADKHEELFSADWDVMYLYYSENGRYQVAAINQDARTVLKITDTRSGEEVQLPDIPEGDITSVNISPSETRMAFYVNSDTSPSNLHVYDLEKKEHRQLTHSLNPQIQPETLVQSEVIRYPSYDELEIPSILYKPHQASSQNKVPALVWVHGGPGGQSRTGYNPTLQHLLNHGYAILAVNNRGSSGYGKTFNHMDDLKHGDVDLKDVVAARSYLAAQDWVDGSQVGIIGGSYGGYMVAAALAFEPEAFDVGVDIFGVTNWVRTLKSIPPWWTSQRDGLYAELGDPAKEEERLTRISPLFHARNITKPLLVIQGANDPRVLQVESDELVEAVRSNGVPVEYVVFPDEGHGFRNKANRIEASEKYVAFLDRYLKGDKGTEAASGQ